MYLLTYSINKIILPYFVYLLNNLSNIHHGMLYCFLLIKVLLRLRKLLLLSKAPSLCCTRKKYCQLYYCYFLKCSQSLRCVLGGVVV